MGLEKKFQRHVNDPRFFGAGCRGKVRYPSKKHAAAVAKRRSAGAGPLEAYSCAACRHWHIGHRRARHKGA